MSYLEIVKRALRERSVNQAAKDWKIPQTTLNKYATGMRLPDYLTAKKIAEEAGISSGEMMDVLAAEEAKRKTKLEKISTSFKSFLRTAKVNWTRVQATA